MRDQQEIIEHKLVKENSENVRILCKKFDSVGVIDTERQIQV